jgi:hypothetical protein
VSEEETDPGWRPAWHIVVGRLPPFFFIPSYRHRRAQDGLTAFRAIFIGVVLPLPLYVLLLAFDRPWNDGSVPSRMVIGLTILGMLSLVFVERARRGLLEIEDPERLAESFRSRSFAGLGFAEMPVLLAFVAVLTSGNVWPYSIGLAFSLLGLWLIAPRIRELTRRQEEIASRGSPLSLVSALKQPRGNAPGAQAGLE